MTHKTSSGPRLPMLAIIVVTALLLSAGMLAWRFASAGQPAQPAPSVTAPAAPSLTARLLGQPAALASTVAAAALITVGLALSVLSRLRQVLATRPPLEKPTLLAEPSPERGARRPAEPVPAEDTPQPSPSQALGLPVTRLEQTPGRTVAATQPQPQQAEGEAKPSQPAGLQTPDAIQEILSSVFESDETVGRYEALQADMEEIDAAALAEACEHIAHELRARRRVAPDAR